MMYACVGGLEHACSITRTDSAASKSKARSEGPTRSAGPERSYRNFAQLRAEEPKNDARGLGRTPEIDKILNSGKP